jgi:hypothetical protein
MMEGVIHCQTFCKCHNVPSTTIKKKETEIYHVQQMYHSGGVW